MVNPEIGPRRPEEEIPQQETKERTRKAAENLKKAADNFNDIINREI